MIPHITRAIRHLLFWLLIIAALGSVAIRLSLTAVEDYKSRLQEKIFELTDLNVQIGSIRAGTRGFNPEIILRDLDVLSRNKQGQPLIKLDEVRLGLDLGKLLFRHSLIASSWISLIGTELTIVRKDDGRITIKGLDSGQDEFPQWLLSGGHYELLSSRIHWQDEKNALAPITFDQVDLLFKSNAAESFYEINLISQLPEQYGSSIRLSAKLNGDLFNSNIEVGKLFLQGQALQFANIFKIIHVPGEIKFIAGSGDLKLWLNWQEQSFELLTVELDSREVVLKKADKSLKLARLSGGLGWRAAEEGERLDIFDLTVQNGSKTYSARQFSIAQSQADILSGRVKGFDLHLLEYLTDFVPSDTLREYRLEFLKTAGVLDDFVFFLNRKNSDYAGQGNFSDISLKTAWSIPDFNGISGYLKGDSQSGLVELNSEASKIYFKDLFRNALGFEHIQGRLSWENNESGLVLNAADIVLKTPVLQFFSRLKMVFPKSDQPVFMDMQMAFNSTDRVKQISPYLPVSVMGREIVEWLENAFIPGEISSGQMLVSGNLDQFPFEQGQGKFEAVFDIDKGVLRYSPEWPRLTDLKAQLHFLANTLDIDIVKARSGNIRAFSTKVHIDNLDRADTVQVDAKINGRITHLLQFMQKTPLHATVDDVVETVDVTGRTTVTVKLVVPIDNPNDTKVAGHFHLKNSQIFIKPIDLTLTAVNGTLSFTEQGLFAKSLKGKLLGHELQANINTGKGKTHIRAFGQLSVSKLYQQFPALQNERVKGLLDYQIDLALSPVPGESSLTLRSNLKGVEVLLPDTLAKTAQQSRPVTIFLQLTAADTLPLWVDYDDELKVALLLRKKDASIYSAHILLGEGRQKLPDRPGITLDIQRNKLDLANWMGLEPGAGSSPLSRLQAVEANIRQLQWNGAALGAFNLHLMRIKNQWRGQMQSEMATGDIVMPVNLNDTGKVILQLSSINVERFKTTASADKDMAIHPKNVPLFDIFAEKFIWQGKNLGKMRVITRRVNSGIRFEMISVNGRHANLDMSGQWLENDQHKRTEFSGNIYSDNLSGFLQDLGFKSDFKETKAHISFSIGWDDSPLAFALQNTEGSFDVDLQGGRIASIEPGFGRLLGLIAIKQWVKRFSLDFSDIYQKGLAFNRITGRFNLDAGKLRTDSLLIDAIAAQIKIAGIVNLTDKTLNHHIWVIPKSSAAIPIAGTIVSGIASAVTRALTDDYKEGYFFGSEYHVYGPWSDVQVTPIHENDGLFKKIWKELTVFPQ